MKILQVNQENRALIYLGRESLQRTQDMKLYHTHGWPNDFSPYHSSCSFNYHLSPNWIQHQFAD